MTELILGAGGMLARGLADERPHARSLGIRDLDITDPAALARAVVPGVRVVRNAAADTRVDFRPASSVLDTSLYERLTGEAPRPFTEALDEHLRLRAEAAGATAA